MCKNEIYTYMFRVFIYYPERANWKSISSSCTLELPAETLLFVEVMLEETLLFVEVMLEETLLFVEVMLETLLFTEVMLAETLLL